MASFLDFLVKLVGFVANLAEIFAGGIAIYLFFMKRHDIMSIFNWLKNYSFKMTLGELNSKIAKIQDLKAGVKLEHNEIVNIFHDIVGQLQGNPHLCEPCKAITDKITETITTPKQLTEGMKRGLTSELKETLKNLDLDSYDNFTKGER
ncbi:hypothetical protein Gbem_3064 [Citrifermentans bemidjiense Bem]|uniref:Uncharacterized protein n=1 Tax=Citrifermentans bemidjiense (strain ATCC BAA-1014 / DSM 16622 / JCM 12645 / Bem) TaxID=404380 RepID=B5E897_CITBB|nr:hypothetical protein [Citrifermentans bemidjiense]ACH40066.1 hypothetical protein Gbem_3064 [Citrifermentans bemidjiense Bem]